MLLGYDRGAWFVGLINLMCLYMYLGCNNSHRAALHHDFTVPIDRVSIMYFYFTNTP